MMEQIWVPVQARSHLLAETLHRKMECNEICYFVSVPEFFTVHVWRFALCSVCSNYYLGTQQLRDGALLS